MPRLGVVWTAGHGGRRPSRPLVIPALPTIWAMAAGRSVVIVGAAAGAFLTYMEGAAPSLVRAADHADRHAHPRRRKVSRGLSVGARRQVV
jgi:hypothetical protein